MRTWSRAILCGAALGLLPPAVRAQSSSKSFDVCGGSFPGSSLLGFCASADVLMSVINNTPTVTIKLWNLSGSQATWDKSIAWTSIMAVGLTNVIPQSVSAVNGSLKVTGPCSAQPVTGCDFSQYWWMSNNVGYAGLVIDMFGMDASGGGIVSNCDPNNPLISRNPYFVTGCGRQSPDFVTMSFAVTQTFDLANGGDLFLKGNYWGTTSSCVTGGGSVQAPNCSPIVAAPEPGTLALLGSGLASFGGLGMFRRRRKAEDEA
jgi:hypothetical protein